MPFPDIDPVLFHIGPLAIRWYGLAYVVGILLGWRYVVALISAPVWGTITPPERRRIDDLATWIILGVLIGGRLGYVLFYQPAVLIYDPFKLFAIWEGGMSFHGGCLGVILAAFLFARRHGLLPLVVGDSIAPAIPIGLFFGRIANFINGELWGRTTDVPWGVVFPGAGFLPRHPSQLYEAALEGVVLFIMLRLLTHHTQALSKPGFVSGALIAGYGIMRFGVEFFREPDAHIGFLFGYFTMGMLLSMPMIIIGALLMGRGAWQKDNRKKATERP